MTKPFEFRGAITDVENQICDNGVTVLARHIPSDEDKEVATFLYGEGEQLTHEQAIEFAELLAAAINKHFREQGQ